MEDENCAVEAPDESFHHGIPRRHSFWASSEADATVVKHHAVDMDLLDRSASGSSPSNVLLDSSLLGDNLHQEGGGRCLDGAPCEAPLLATLLPPSPTPYHRRRFSITVETVKQEQTSDGCGSPASPAPPAGAAAGKKAHCDTPWAGSPIHADRQRRFSSPGDVETLFLELQQLLCSPVAGKHRARRASQYADEAVSAYMAGNYYGTQASCSAKVEARCQKVLASRRASDAGSADGAPAPPSSPGGAGGVLGLASPTQPSFGIVAAAMGASAALAADEQMPAGSEAMPLAAADAVTRDAAMKALQRALDAAEDAAEEDGCPLAGDFTGTGRLSAKEAALAREALGGAVALMGRVAAWFESSTQEDGSFNPSVFMITEEEREAAPRLETFLPGAVLFRCACLAAALAPGGDGAAAESQLALHALAKAYGHYQALPRGALRWYVLEQSAQRSASSKRVYDAAEPCKARQPELDAAAAATRAVAAFLRAAAAGSAGSGAFAAMLAAPCVNPMEPSSMAIAATKVATVAADVSFYIPCTLDCGCDAAAAAAANALEACAPCAEGAITDASITASETDVTVPANDDDRRVTISDWIVSGGAEAADAEDAVVVASRSAVGGCAAPEVAPYSDVTLVPRINVRKAGPASFKHGRSAPCKTASDLAEGPIPDHCHCM